MKCLLCGSTKNKFIFNYRGTDIYLNSLGAGGFRLKWFKCLDCCVYFSRQHKEIERIYDDVNLYDAQYDHKGIGQRFRKIMNLGQGLSDNAVRVKRVKAFHKRYLEEFGITKRIYSILDVGAGLGVFLARFLDNDYRGEALEINRVAVRHLKEILSLPVHSCRIEEAAFKHGFDLITLNRVVEHIKEPIPFLISVKEALNRKGMIYLELPDSIGYELCGERCDAFASGHYMTYNPESVLYLLKKSGLETLTMNRLLESSGKRTIYVFARRVA